MHELGRSAHRASEMSGEYQYRQRNISNEWRREIARYIRNDALEIMHMPHWK